MPIDELQKAWPVLIQFVFSITTTLLAVDKYFWSVLCCLVADSENLISCAFTGRQSATFNVLWSTQSCLRIGPLNPRGQLVSLSIFNESMRAQSCSLLQCKKHTYNCEGFKTALPANK